MRLHVVGGSMGARERRPIRVLYVEDDEDDVFLLGRHLDRMPSFEPDYVSTPTLDDARQLLARESFDVVLCDFWLGSETTIPLIDELSLSPRPSPVVLVSSLENEDIELIGRRAGAAGFVAKADLSASALDRVFSTLLPVEVKQSEAAGSGIGVWLRALMRSIDRAKTFEGVQGHVIAGRDAVAAVIAEAFGPDVDRDDLMRNLAGLERATSGSIGTTRFDAVPYVTDAVRALRSRVEDQNRVRFTAPVFPILIDSTPALFGDLIQGFFAEAVDALGGGASIEVAMAIVDGALEVTVQALGASTSTENDDRAARAAAAAEARRFLAGTLATASGGTLAYGAAGSGRIGLLRVPLRSKG